MPDAIFADPRLAAIYDVMDGDRGDLELYASIATAMRARSVLDIGCGTGTFACMLARRGVDVVGVEPAAASLAVARSKPGAERVHWVHGDATALPARTVDLATMTGNVAQVFVSDAEWAATLHVVHAGLRPGGRLVFETRDPARRAWLEWTPEQTYRRVEVAGVGVVQHWIDLLDVDGSLVTFRGTYVFESDGAVLTSDSTLRFRSRPDLADSLAGAGFQIEAVCEAPDRPKREFVFIARRAD